MAAAITAASGLVPSHTIRPNTLAKVSRLSARLVTISLGVRITIHGCRAVPSLNRISPSATSTSTWVWISMS